MKKSTKGGERMRNRLLIFMTVAVLVLVLVIIATAPKKGELPVSATSGTDENSSSTVRESDKPESSNSQSESQVSSESESESRSKSESNSQSANGSKPQSVGSSASESKPQSASNSTGESKPLVKPSDDPYYEATMPMLVNSTNKIPSDYKPDVEVIGGGSSYSYDRRAVVGYRAMAAAAKADGITLSPVSAYRSNERQTTNFKNKTKEYENMGYTVEQAYAATAQLIAIPGTSEHELGLAIDLNSLETSFENTKTFTWLFEHCAEYGFILRYPKDKTEITEISYEPWHYRYVGSNHAKIIMQQGICLEEYLSGDY